MEERRNGLGLLKRLLHLFGSVYGCVFWCRYGLARPVEEAAALVWFGLWLCFLVQVQTDIEQIRTGVVQDK